MTPIRPALSRKRASERADVRVDAHAARAVVARCMMFSSVNRVPVEFAGYRGLRA